MNEIAPGVMTITLVTQKHGNLKRVWFQDMTETQDLRPMEALAPDHPGMDTSWFWEQVPEGFTEWDLVVPLLEGVSVNSDGIASIELTADMGITINLVGLPPRSVLERIED